MMRVNTHPSVRYEAMPIELVCLDADDTLWHNERHFREAENVILEAVRPVASPEDARVRIAECATRNLPVYGYGVKSFILSTLEAVMEIAGGPIDQTVIQTILKVGRELLEQPVSLLDDVEETLIALRRNARLLILTKGDLMHQEMKIAGSGLGDLVDAIEIVSDKNAGTLRRVLSRQSVRPANTLVVGDSIRSDINPALEAGAWAAYVPMDGAWLHETGSVPDGHPRFAKLARFRDLIELVEALGSADRFDKPHPGAIRKGEP